MSTGCCWMRWTSSWTVWRRRAGGPSSSTWSPTSATRARVAEVGDHVDELGPPALRLQTVQDDVHLIQQQPVLIHGKMNHLCLIGGEGSQRPGVRWTLCQHHITGVHEGLGYQINGLLAPRGNQHVSGIDLRPLCSHDLCYVLLQEVKALRGPVLEGQRPLLFGYLCVYAIKETLREAARSG